MARAELLAGILKPWNVESAILLMLYDLQFPVNCAGFDYLRKAILVAYRCRSQIVAVEVFSTVGELYVPKVEFRCMDAAVHDAIRKAWRSRWDHGYWGKYLPDYLVRRRKAPSNLEFICYIVYFLEFWQDCYEKEASYERT